MLYSVLHSDTKLSMSVHSVMEEGLLYLCNEEASVSIELSGGSGGFKNDDFTYSKEWVFDLLNDMDIGIY